MLVPQEEIVRAFRKIAEVRAHVSAAYPHRHPAALNYEQLSQAISSLSKLDIRICVVIASGSLVAGKIERYRDGKVVILTKHDLSEDLLRFVIVKELCHLIIDDEPDWTDDPIKVVREMKAEFDLASLNGNGVQNPSRIQMSEHLAIVGAVSLMYPCERHEKDMQDVFDRKTNISRIALEFKMPVWAIELAFTRGEIFSLFPC